MYLYRTYAGPSQLWTVRGCTFAAPTVLQKWNNPPRLERDNGTRSECLRNRTWSTRFAVKQQPTPV